MEGSDRKSPIFRDIRRYYCEFCGICRSKKSLITSHVLSNHQEEIKGRKFDEEKEGPSLNICEDCGAEFKKPAHLKQHILSHSLEGQEIQGWLYSVQTNLKLWLEPGQERLAILQFGHGLADFAVEIAHLQPRA